MKVMFEAVEQQTVSPALKKSTAVLAEHKRYIIGGVIVLFLIAGTVSFVSRGRTPSSGSPAGSPSDGSSPGSSAGAGNGVRETHQTPSSDAPEDARATAGVGDLAPFTNAIAAGQGRLDIPGDTSHLEVKQVTVKPNGQVAEGIVGFAGENNGAKAYFYKPAGQWMLVAIQFQSVSCASMERANVPAQYRVECVAEYGPGGAVVRGAGALWK